MAKINNYTFFLDGENFGVIIMQNSREVAYVKPVPARICEDLCSPLPHVALAAKVEVKRLLKRMAARSR